jgi:hypothetical protein
MSMRKYLILFFIFSTTLCFAQDSLNGQDFENDSIAVYKKSRDFEYTRYLDSLLKNKKDLGVDTFSISGHAKSGKQQRITIHSGGNSFFNIPSVTAILWVLAVFFIGFVLHRLFFTKGFFRRESTRKDLTGIKQEEKISDPSGYDRLIAEAVAGQNYRLAIRYLYLQTLQILSNKGLIQLSPDKTNYEYVRELSGKVYQDDFSGITLGYEYVWYGKFEIGKDIYQKLSGDYRSFQQKF